MPTGYTAAVKDGEITEFGDFAKHCARAFGAFYHMRDEPSDAPLRMEEPSGYFAKRLPEAQAELKRLEGLTDDEWRTEWEQWWAEEQASHKRRMAQNAETRSRYESMIAKVEAWAPPSDEHVEFKEFMLSQLRESLQFDTWKETAPDHWSLDTFKAQKVSAAQRDITYLTEHFDKERKAIESRRRWAEQLLESLGEAVPA